MSRPPNDVLPPLEEDNHQIYIAKIGEVTTAWNMLQEFVGMIFAETFPSPNKGIPLSIWHSQQSDRNQKRMLRAAVEAGAFVNWKHKLPKTCSDDIIWLINESNELSGRRDEAVHSPIVLLKSANNTVALPFNMLGNPLARRLAGKNLISELELSTWRANKLRNYALAIVCALQSENSPWPNRRPTLSRELHRQQMAQDRQ